MSPARTKRKYINNPEEVVNTFVYKWTSDMTIAIVASTAEEARTKLANVQVEADWDVFQMTRSLPLRQESE